ncbi:hypothetical protein GCM10027610_072890 [Dactylosporangium cerinum]
MQAFVMVRVHTSGCVNQKVWGTPGTVEYLPRGTSAASCARGHGGRMSSPAAMKCIGTAQAVATQGHGRRDEKAQIPAPAASRLVTLSGRSG